MLNELARPRVAAEKRADEQGGTYSVPAYNTDGRRVGAFVYSHGDGLWLVKWRLDPCRHMLWAPRGWATDKAHLDYLLAQQGRGVRLHLVNGDTWTAPLAAFTEFGIRIQRGHGRQVVLPEACWRVEGRDCRAATLVPSEPELSVEASDQRQLALL